MHTGIAHLLIEQFAHIVFHAAEHIGTINQITQTTVVIRKGLRARKQPAGGDGFYAIEFVVTERLDDIFLRHAIGIGPCCRACGEIAQCVVTVIQVLDVAV